MVSCSSVLVWVMVLGSSLLPFLCLAATSLQIASTAKSPSQLSSNFLSTCAEPFHTSKQQRSRIAIPSMSERPRIALVLPSPSHSTADNQTTRNFAISPPSASTTLLPIWGSELACTTTLSPPLSHKSLRVRSTNGQTESGDLRASLAPALHLSEPACFFLQLLE
jgi:hypothetical protein